MKHSITVSRAELEHALRLVTVGLRGNTIAEVRFSLVSGFLEIAGPGAAHSLAAEGTWPSAILADGGVLKRVASRLPTGEPLVLKVESSRLYIGTFSLEATVLDIAPVGTQLPIGATGADILIAVERLGEARVAGSIGTQAIESAREELLAGIDQAVRALKPFGIAEAEVARLVRRTMREKATSRLPKNRTCSTARSPTPSEMEDMSVRALSEGAKELLAERQDNRDAVKFNEIPLASAEGNPDVNLGLKIHDDEQAMKHGDCWSCPTHDAILEFANERYSALTRKVVFHLQRIKASGVYGDDYRHKSLWDEYCHEVQEGPYDLLDNAWDRTLTPALSAIVDAIPRYEAALLTIGAIWDLDEEYELAPVIMPDLIRRNLEQMVSKLAGARDMSRFDPTLF